jgi:hypothetical protein
MSQKWILQGRHPVGEGEWLDLIAERSRKAVVRRFRPDIARALGAEYQIVISRKHRVCT